MDILTSPESPLGHPPQFDQAESELVDLENTYARRGKPKASCRFQPSAGKLQLQGSREYERADLQLLQTLGLRLSDDHVVIAANTARYRPDGWLAGGKEHGRQDGAKAATKARAGSSLAKLASRRASRSANVSHAGNSRIGCRTSSVRMGNTLGKFG